MNTSLMGPGALAHRLQHRNACNTTEANLQSPNQISIVLQALWSTFANFLQGYTPLGHLMVLVVFIISLFAIFGLMWLFVSISQINLIITKNIYSPFFSLFRTWKGIQVFNVLGQICGILPQTLKRKQLRKKNSEQIYQKKQLKKNYSEQIFLAQMLKKIECTISE